METNNTKFSRSGLLLVEILLAILFFSLSASVCLRMFVSSHQMSRESRLLEHAVTQSTSVAEVLIHYGCVDIADAMKVPVELLQNGESDGQTLCLYFREDGTATDPLDAEVCLSAAAVVRPKLTYWTITVTDLQNPGGTKTLYKLPVTVYPGK